MKMKICAVVAVLITSQGFGQEIAMQKKNFTAVNVVLDEVSYKNKNGLRVYEREQGKESIAILNSVQFSDGVIELELAGSTVAGADPGARGFIGIAFRVTAKDSIRYDCFYLRPANGRSDDQVRRNHSTQYIAHPSYPWYRLRKEFPAKYESYVDLEQGVWTNVKIVVRDAQAQLFVHNADQPALIVNNLLNRESSGGIALWVGQGTDGHFRALKVTKQ